MWKLFRTLRILCAIGAIAYLVISNFSIGAIALSAFTAALWLIHQCRTHRPGGVIPHNYDGGKDTIGALRRTRIDSTMHRCRRVATRFLLPSGISAGGCFCAKHAKEEKEWR